MVTDHRTQVCNESKTLCNNDVMVPSQQTILIDKHSIYRNPSQKLLWVGCHGTTMATIPYLMQNVHVQKCFERVSIFQASSLWADKQSYQILTWVGTKCQQKY